MSECHQSDCEPEMDEADEMACHEMLRKLSSLSAYVHHLGQQHLVHLGVCWLMSAGYVSLNLLSNNATLISIGESTNSLHWIMTNTNLQKLKKGCHYSQTFVSKDQHYNLNRFPMHKVCINYGFKISEVQEKTTLRLAGWVEILDTTLYKQASPLCRLSI